MVDRSSRATARRESLWLTRTKPADLLWDAANGDFTSAAVAPTDASGAQDDIADRDGYDTGVDEDVAAEPFPESPFDNENAAASGVDGPGNASAAAPATSSSASSSMPSIGAHLNETHVFTVEILSNRTISAVIVVYYIIFAALLVYGLSGYLDTRSSVLLYIAPPGNNGSDDALLCLPNPDADDGTCEPNPKMSRITVAEADLLSNTVLVSEGLNLSDWRGDHAAPGTPPFSAHDKSSGAFLLDASGLDYDANPDLHDVWSDLSGALWFGSSRTEALLQGGEIARSSKSVGVSLNFIRPDGTPWPDGTAENGTLPLTMHAYACLKGQACSSIGAYRSQFLPEPNAWVPDREPYRLGAQLSLGGEGGSVLMATFDIPNLMVEDDVIDGVGWRFAASADPGGAVSACAAGDNCVVEVGLTVGVTSAGMVAEASIELAVLVLYFPYFVWWIVTVCVRLGTKLNRWPLEDIWLLYLGVGFLMHNGFIWASLSIKRLRQDDFVFNEKLWAAASILSLLGEVLELFALACFADAPRRYVVSPLAFYGWKVLYCLILWTSMVVTILYNYPLASGRDEPGTDLAIGGLGFVTAPETWPRHEKIALSSFQLVWLTCTFFGIGYYFWRSHKTKRVLADLPYNMTRPVQLSFRFFRWATLIWVVAEFLSILYSVGTSLRAGHHYSGYANGGLNALVVALNQVETFQVHTNVFSILFGLVFTVVFLGFFLPPSAESAVPKSHHVTEEKAEEAANEERSKGEFLLVLDRARLLCTCSRETYLPFSDEERRRDTKVTKEDPVKSPSTRFGDDEDGRSPTAGEGPAKPGTTALKETLHKYLEEAAEVESKRTVPRRGGFDRVDSWMPTVTFAKARDPHPLLEARIAGDPVCWGEPSPPGSTWAMGCRVIKRISEPSYANMHDSKALLLRHEPSGDLILAFRGTKSGKQIKTDLMTQKVEVSLSTFLTISSNRERARRIVEGVVPEDLEEMMREGTAGKVKILDLLHRDNDEELPDFLRGRTNAGDGLRGYTKLHFGFFSSYSRLRKQVHSAVYEELVANPGRLLVCGHSLGGAQATACAYDMARWIIPSVKEALLNKNGRIAADKVTMCCYTYGSPRLGCRRFRAAFDNAVPETQRIINDGDIVTLTPPKLLGFVHAGTEDVFDYTGSLIANPSMIEKKFANKSRRHTTAHYLPNYTRAIKRAYHPVMPIESLLDMIRDAYGLNEESK